MFQHQSLRIAVGRRASGLLIGWTMLRSMSVYHTIMQAILYPQPASQSSVQSFHVFIMMILFQVPNLLRALCILRSSNLADVWQGCSPRIHSSACCACLFKLKIQLSNKAIIRHTFKQHINSCDITTEMRHWAYSTMCHVCLSDDHE